MLRKISICLLAALALLQLSAGAATELDLEDHFVSSGSSIFGNITVDSSENIYLTLDKDGDGQYSASADSLASNTSVSGSGFYRAEIDSSNTTNLNQGNYSLYARQSSSAPSDGDLLSAPETEIEVENVDPKITEFNVGKIDEKTMNISLKSNESIDQLRSQLQTPSSTLNLQGVKTDSEPSGDFKEVSSGSNYIYYSIYYVNQQGTFSANLIQAADRYGNDGSSGEIDSNSFNPIINSIETRLKDKNIQARILSIEQLSRIVLSVEGAKNLKLDESNFSESILGADYEYIANISTDGTDGEYNATLYTAQNNTGYEGAWNQSVVQNYGLPPSFDNFFLHEPSSQDVDLSINSNEQLSSIEVFVNKTVNRKLTFSDFTENSVSNGYNYTADVNSGVDGDYNATLLTAEDTSGYNDTYNENDSLTVDSNPPTISNFEAYESSEGDLKATLLSSEVLGSIEVGITGQETAQLKMENFSTPDSNPDYNYTGAYEPGSDGTYNFELMNAEDQNGNDGSSSETDSVTLQTAPKINVFNIYSDNQDVDIEVESTQPLNTLEVELGKDASGTLSKADFDEKSTDPWSYEANVSNGNDGVFNATLVEAKDSDGFDGADGEEDQVTVDTQPPQDPTSTDIINEPINSDKEDSVEVDVYFNSIPEDGTLTVKAFDESGNTELASGFVDTTSSTQTISNLNVESLNDGDIWVKAKIEDNQGNSNPSGFTANSSKSTKDTSAPQLDKVITGEDLSKNNTDSSKLSVDYTEANSIDLGTLEAGDFLINSGNLGISSVSADSQKITINLNSNIGTGSKPTVEVDGVIRDSTGNKISEQTGLTAEDGLKPTLEKAIVDSQRSDSTGTVISLTFSEDITNGNGVEFAGSSSTKVAQGGNKIHLDVEEVIETGNEPQITSLNKVTDTSDNTAESTSKTVKSFEKTIPKGWTTFSLPVEDNKSYDISEILDESKISTIWSYESGNWELYSSKISNDDFTELEPGKGYLINSTESQTIRPNVDTKGDGDSATISIENGWNLVSNMQEYEQSADSSGAFSSLSSIQKVKAQNKSEELSYERIGQGSATPKDVAPGDAYWLESSSSDSLTGSFARRPPGVITGLSQFFWNSLNSFNNLLGDVLV